MPTSSDLPRRRALLTAALAALRVKQEEPELAMVHRWLDNWTGLGHVVTGMQRQGYRLHLTDVDGSAWRATFNHAPLLSSDGFGTGPTPWRAAQVAAWKALKPGSREASTQPEVDSLP